MRRRPQGGAPEGRARRDIQEVTSWAVSYTHLVCIRDSYWLRNGDDNHLAKNLPRWLSCDDGLAAWADEPIPPDIFAADGEPLDMAGLAQADPDFAKLWRKVQTRRSVIRSQLYMDGTRPPEERVLELCADDGPYKRYWAACEERYARYLKMCDLFAMSAEEMAQLRDAQASLCLLYTSRMRLEGAGARGHRGLRGRLRKRYAHRRPVPQRRGEVPPHRREVQRDLGVVGGDGLHLGQGRERRALAVPLRRPQHPVHHLPRRGRRLERHGALVRKARRDGRQRGDRAHARPTLSLIHISPPTTPI